MPAADRATVRLIAKQMVWMAPAYGI